MHSVNTWMDVMSTRQEQKKNLGKARIEGTMSKHNECHLHFHIFVTTKLFLYFHKNMSRICWLHQRNLKQQTVSPVRPHRCLNTHTLTFPPHYPGLSLSLLCFASAGFSSALSLSISIFVDLHIDIPLSKLEYHSHSCMPRISSTASWVDRLSHESLCVCLCKYPL